MNPLTEERINEVQALCRRFGVHRLDVFGSAATGSFDPATSDIDFNVEFEDARSPDMFERYFGLKESFEALFDRPVDLLVASAMAKPLLHRIGQSLAPSCLCVRARLNCLRPFGGRPCHRGAHRPSRTPCRNILIHGYDLLDHGLVLTTAENQAPKLLAEVEALLAERV